MNLKIPESLIFTAPRYYMKNNTTLKPFLFFIIGCGGTGGYVVRDLSRLVSIFNQKHSRNDKIILCDGDEVRF